MCWHKGGEYVDLEPIVVLSVGDSVLDENEESFKSNLSWRVLFERKFESSSVLQWRDCDEKDLGAIEGNEVVVLVVELISTWPLLACCGSSRPTLELKYIKPLAIVVGDELGRGRSETDVSVLNDGEVVLNDGVQGEYEVVFDKVGHCLCCKFFIFLFRSRL